MDYGKLISGLLGSNVQKGAKPTSVFSGIGCGFLLLILAIGVTYFSVTGVKEESAIVNSIALMDSSEVTDDTRGLVKLFGQLETDESLDTAVEFCFDRFCDFAGDEKKFEDLLYYHISFERFEVEREVKKQTKEDGSRDVTETVEYNEVWVEKDSLEDWADVTMSDIDIDAAGAKRIIDTQTEELEGVFIDGLEGVETYGQKVSASVGDTRATITYLSDDDREYIVAGELRSDGIRGGEVFILTDLGDSELVSHLQSSESFMRWALRGLAWLMLTIGFTSILAPVLALTDFIPLVGGAARAAATFVSAVVALIIVLTTVFFLNFWWLCLLSVVVLLLLLAGGFVFWYKNKGEKASDEKK